MGIIQRAYAAHLYRATPLPKEVCDMVSKYINPKLELVSADDVAKALSTTWVYSIRWLYDPSVHRSRPIHLSTFACEEHKKERCLAVILARSADGTPHLGSDTIYYMGDGAEDDPEEVRIVCAHG
jgi:hypothetical protein